MSFTLYDDLTGYEEAVRNRIRDCIGNVGGGGKIVSIFMVME